MRNCNQVMLNIFPSSVSSRGAYGALQAHLFALLPVKIWTLTGDEMP